MTTKLSTYKNRELNVSEVTRNQVDTLRSITAHLVKYIKDDVLSAYISLDRKLVPLCSAVLATDNIAIYGGCDGHGKVREAYVILVVEPSNYKDLSSILDSLYNYQQEIIYIPFMEIVNGVSRPILSKRMPAVRLRPRSKNQTSFILDVTASVNSLLKLRSLETSIDAPEVLI